MKKALLLFVSIFSFSMLSFAQLDTVIGFTFPVQTGLDSLNANSGTAQNMGYDIRFETTAGDSTRPITLTNGVTNYAATGTDWANCADDVFFSIKMKTPDYYNLVLYSKQRSGGSNPGPKYFKVQYQISGDSVWTDIAGGDVTVANDWTTGVVDGIALPSATWNSSSSVYIRWVATSNENVDGGTCDVNSISKIDEIFVLGNYSAVGIDESSFNSVVYPNPATDVVNFESNEPIAFVSIMTIDGRIVSAISNPGQTIDISNLTSGYYMMRIVSEDNNQQIHNLIVE